MSDENALQAAMRELRHDYLAEAPERLAELRADLEALQAGAAGSLTSLKGRFHRLAGSGGSYGLADVSSISRDMEQWLRTIPAAGAAEVARIAEAIARLETAFLRAREADGG